MSQKISKIPIIIAIIIVFIGFSIIITREVSTMQNKYQYAKEYIQKTFNIDSLTFNRVQQVWQSPKLKPYYLFIFTTKDQNDIYVIIPRYQHDSTIRTVAFSENTLIDITKECTISTKHCILTPDKSFLNNFLTSDQVQSRYGFRPFLNN